MTYTIQRIHHPQDNPNEVEVIKAIHESGRFECTIESVESKEGDIDPLRRGWIRFHTFGLPDTRLRGTACAFLGTGSMQADSLFSRPVKSPPPQGSTQARFQRLSSA